MSPFAPEELLRIAFEHHQAGRFPNAEAGYRQILEQFPNHPGTTHWLGVLYAQNRRYDLAVDLLKRAIVLDPNVPDFHSNLGTVYRETGKLDEAIACYQRALTLNPDFAAVHSNLGTVLRDKGRLDDAIACYKKAIKLDRKDPQAHLNLGMAMNAKGKAFDAVESMEHALRLNPNYPEGFFQLGLALKGGKRAHEAAGCFERALVLRPEYAEAHNALGVERHAEGRMDDAAASYRRALSLKPDYAEAHNNLGATLVARGLADEAIACYEKALSLNPNFLQALTNMSAALREKQRFDEALAFNERALRMRPDDVEALYSMGAALFDAGRFDEALTHLQRALSIQPNHGNSLVYLGLTLREKNRLREAVSTYERAIKLRPDFVEAHFDLAIALLAMGDYLRGWQEYEWRWKYPTFPSPRRDFPQPQWQGEPIAGRTILLHSEQGHGDTLQFIRYVPMVAKLGAKVVVECEPTLKRLFQGAMPDCEWVAKGEALPRFDVHSPLMSLPRAFGTTMETIPQQTPPLTAEAGDVASWRERMANEPAAFRVGLVWAGGRGHSKDRYRSIALAAFAPLAAAKGVRFYSLQKGEPAKQASQPPAGMQLVDWSAELYDFADTAALIANLDLVVSIDTSVVHLAGAMGKPVWTLVPFVPDWRWLLEGDDNRWYPSMRLFRQTAMNDWTAAIAKVAEALQTQPGC